MRRRTAERSTTATRSPSKHSVMPRPWRTMNDRFNALRRASLCQEVGVAGTEEREGGERERETLCAAADGAARWTVRSVHYVAAIATTARTRWSAPHVPAAAVWGGGVGGDAWRRREAWWRRPPRSARKCNSGQRWYSPAVALMAVSRACLCSVCRPAGGSCASRNTRDARAMLNEGRRRERAAQHSHSALSTADSALPSALRAVAALGCGRSSPAPLSALSCPALSAALACP